MRWFVAFLASLLLTSQVYAAVGDLTPKPCAGGWPVWVQGKTDVAHAPAGCGTVNPAAEVITIRSTSGGKLTFQVALDSAKPDDKVLNLLRIDVTGKGQFKDAPAVEVKWSSADGGGRGDVDASNIPFVRDGRQVPTTLAGYFMANKNTVLFGELTVGSCLEGQCAFGDKTRTVRFVDRTGNGTGSTRFQVKVKDGVPCGVAEGDQVQIDSGDGKFGERGSYGQLMLVDGTWYDIAVSADGKKVTATASKPSTGGIHIDGDKWTLSLAGTEHLLSLNGGKAALDNVPVGKYYVRQATIRRSDTYITFRNTPFDEGKAVPFEVVAGKTTELGLGAALRTTQKATMGKGTVDLHSAITDAAGTTVFSVKHVLADGSMENFEDPGRFEVFGPDGKRLALAPMVYK
jgi:hypothetical protein